MKSMKLELLMPDERKLQIRNVNSAKPFFDVKNS